MEKSALEMRLEKAAALYLETEAWTAALRVYVALAEQNAANPNGWFGIGSILWRLSATEADLLPAAVAALKRAADLNRNPDNKHYKRVLFSATESARKAGLDPDGIAPAGDEDAREALIAAEFERDQLIAATRALPWDQRVQIVHAFADQPELLLVQACVSKRACGPNAKGRATAPRALAARPAASVRDGLIEAGAARADPLPAEDEDADDAEADATDAAASADEDQSDDDDDTPAQKRMVIYPEE